jgi:DNA-binding response OmpR family regulator
MSAALRVSNSTLACARAAPGAPPSESGAYGRVVVSMSKIGDPKTRVLIVDDSRHFREMLAVTLRLTGFEVEEAPDGEHALRMLRRQDLDIVVVDLFMPAMDGFELIREIRSRYAAMGIIAMSGVTNTGGGAWHEMAHKLGADIGLVKPFSRTEFLSAVKELVSGCPS